MVSPVDICNQALSQMGARARVRSINPSDGSPAGDACSMLYQTQVDAVSRSAHWNCLRLQAPLAVMRAAPGTPENPTGTTVPLPPIPWIYEYALPPDCLKARFVIPTPSPQPAVSPPLTTGPTNVMAWNVTSTAMPFVPAVDTTTSGPLAQTRVLLTNACRAQLVYTARITNPDLWDAQFAEAVIAVLAAWLVNPLNMKAALLTERVQVAQGLIGAARLSDGNEGIQPDDHIPDWIQARWRRGSLGATNAGPYFAGWDQLSLPGGISY